MMPVLELVHVVCALAHENVAAVAGRSPPSWRALGIASSFIASSPITLDLRLGKRRHAFRGGEGPVRLA